MATTEAAVPVNGNYAPQAYDAVANNFAAPNATSASGYGAQQGAPSQPASSASNSEIPKDEVGWYFVEQYYTTLSKSPERLYLFYNKRSQFVSGTEEDKVNVCIGQKSINDKIKDLDFHDTKVRVTNVDSQGSDAHIVIQVIGEISNKGQPHKRFVQTFVLAEQTNGYFVLNDIFRYLAEEPEEEEEQLQQDASSAPSGVQEPAPTAAPPATESLNKSDEIASSEEDLQKVDHKLEETVQEEPAREASPPPAAVNGTPVPEAAEAAEADEAPAAAVSAPKEAPKETPAPAVEETMEPEKPKDPTPTPVAATRKPAPPTSTPAAPPKPAVPRTWASLAASANKTAVPNVPAPATPQAPTQAKAAAPSPAPAQAPAAPAAQSSAPARDPSPSNSQGEAAGWTPVAAHKKEQSRAQNQPQGGEADQRRAYIKNVFSQVEEGALKSALNKFGEVEYLDISRQKNCAFVDFKTPAGFQNAVNNNPHTVNGIEIKVEERRMGPGAFRGGFRGGPRGRGGPMGSQGPRGGYGGPRGGRGGVRGGRPAAQEA